MTLEKNSIKCVCRGSAVAVSLWFVFCGCSSKSDKCVYDSDCSDGKICIGGVCMYLSDGGQDSGYDAGHDAGYDAGFDAGDDGGQLADEGNGDDGGMGDGNGDGGDGGQQHTGVDVLRVDIGTAANEIGVSGSEEGNPEGPMSFAVAPDDTIYLLDQVNSRVQIYRNSSWIGSIPVPHPTFVDMDLTSDGKVVLLDNCVQRALFLLDAQGNVLGTFPLEGANVPAAEGVTAVFFRGAGELAGTWVETDERAVRLILPDGSADPDRIAVPGILSADGERLVRASLIGEVTVMLYLSGYGAGSWDEFSVLFDVMVAHLLGVFVDLDEKVYLGAYLSDDEETKNVFVVLNSEGDEVKRILLFLQQREEEIYRSVRVTPDGRIFQLALDERGVVVWRYDP